MYNVSDLGIPNDKINFIPVLCINYIPKYGHYL